MTVKAGLPVPKKYSGGYAGITTFHALIFGPNYRLGSGVYEVALAWRGDAYRTAYIVQMGPDVWVVHAFQKKSTKGIKTPKHEIELIRERIKRLKEMLT